MKKFNKFLISALIILFIAFSFSYAGHISKKVEQKPKHEKVENKNQIQHPKSKIKYPTSNIKHRTSKIKHPNSDLIEKKYHKYYHKPYKKVHIHKKRYLSPLKYFYTIHPRFIYRGLWIRISINHSNGYYFYNGYPYFVYNGYLHRYSSSDPGCYDLVDRYTHEVYATFYGNSLKQSYDRCAELRDLLNNKLGEYRYFCAERYEHNPDYSYGWYPYDYPNCYWK